MSLGALARSSGRRFRPGTYLAPFFREMFFRPDKVSVLVLVLALSSSSVPAASEGTAPGVLGDARARLEASRTPAAWESAARELLSLLDSAGVSPSEESEWLVRRLLEFSPDDAGLLWRRAAAHKRAGERDHAIAILESLASGAARDTQQGRMARQALPSLYEKEERWDEALAADRALLAEGLADPSEMLRRAARIHSARGEVGAQRRALKRLERIDREALHLDPDMLWLAAEASEALGEPDEAARAWLRFANIAPSGDSRVAKAWYQAARALARIGDAEAALLVTEGALSLEADVESRMATHVLRAELLDALDRDDAAWRELARALELSRSPESSAQVLRRLLDLDVERGGIGRALLSAVALSSSFGGITEELAGSHFDRLARAGWESGAWKRATLLEWTLLAERSGRLGSFPAAARLRAAELYEQAGADEDATHLYRTLAETVGPEGRAARAGLRRVDPAGPRARTPAAALDEPPDEDQSAPLGALLERADTLFDGGRIDEGCRLLTRSKHVGSAAQSAWREYRMGACALREGKRRIAASHLAHAVEQAPDSPAALAARELAGRAELAVAGGDS